MKLASKKVYATEIEAAVAASRLEFSDWNLEVDHYGYVAIYCASVEGWRVAIRPFVPGTCT